MRWISGYAGAEPGARPIQQLTSTVQRRPKIPSQSPLETPARRQATPWREYAREFPWVVVQTASFQHQNIRLRQRLSYPSTGAPVGVLRRGRRFDKDCQPNPSFWKCQNQGHPHVRPPLSHQGNDFRDTSARHRSPCWLPQLNRKRRHVRTHFSCWPRTWRFLLMLGNTLQSPECWRIHAGTWDACPLGLRNLTHDNAVCRCRRTAFALSVPAHVRGARIFWKAMLRRGRWDFLPKQCNGRPGIVQQINF